MLLPAARLRKLCIAATASDVLSKENVDLHGVDGETIMAPIFTTELKKDQAWARKVPSGTTHIRHGMWSVMPISTGSGGNLLLTLYTAEGLYQSVGNLSGLDWLSNNRVAVLSLNGT